MSTTDNVKMMSSVAHLIEMRSGSLEAMKVAVSVASSVASCHFDMTVDQGARMAKDICEIVAIHAKASAELAGASGT